MCHLRSPRNDSEVTDMRRETKPVRGLYERGPGWYVFWAVVVLAVIAGFTIAFGGWGGALFSGLKQSGAIK